MNNHQILYFLKIADLLNFSRAADELFISQSSLSKQIKTLENELRVTLFIRRGNQVSLSAAGEIFLSFAHSFEERIQELHAKLSRYEETHISYIRLGALPLLYEYGLSADLARFEAENPLIRVEILEREQSELIRLINSGGVDMALIRTDALPENEYECGPGIRDRMVVVSRKNHPLATRKTIDWDDLRTETLVILDQRSQTFTLMIGYLTQNNLEKNLLTSSRHLPLLDMVKVGLGLGILPQKLACASGCDDLVCIPLSVPIFSNIALVRKAKQEHSLASDILFAYFRRLRAKKGTCPEVDEESFAAESLKGE